MICLGLISALAAPELPPGPPEAPTEEPPPEEEEPPNRDDDIFGPPVETEKPPNRDDDIFGTPDEPKAPEPAEPEPKEPGPAGLGGDLLTDREMSDALDARDDTLAIGGRIYLRADLGISESDESAETMDLSSPNLLDVFLDARPNDRVRAFARGRLTYDWTLGPDEVDSFTGEPIERGNVRLDQLWIKFDVARKAYVTVGAQRVKWGTGRFWNPTDFTALQALDPLAVFDLRTGTGLVRVHVPFEKAGVNVYALANMDAATVAGQIGGAGRIEWLVGKTEMAASVAGRNERPFNLGFDLSSGISVFDLRVEAAVLKGVATPFWKGELDPATLAFPERVDRFDEWIPQVVAGLETSIRYNDEDTVTVGGEFFYNDAGYDDAELYPWLLFQGQFTPLYLGRMYGGVYIFLPSPGRWDDVTFTASMLGNLSDSSYIGRFDYRHTFLTWLDFNAYVAGHFGQNGELRYGVEVPAVPGLLEEAFVLDAPLIDVGAGAAVRF